jgi:hypothetical protein
VRTSELLSVCCQLLEIFRQNTLKSIQILNDGTVRSPVQSVRTIFVFRLGPYFCKHGEGNCRCSSLYPISKFLQNCGQQRNLESIIYSPQEKNCSGVSWGRRVAHVTRTALPNYCRLSFRSKNPARRGMGKIQRRSVLGYHCSEIVLVWEVPSKCLRILCQSHGIQKGTKTRTPFV